MKTSKFARLKLGRGEAAQEPEIAVFISGVGRIDCTELLIYRLVGTVRASSGLTPSGTCSMPNTMPKTTTKLADGSNCAYCKVWYPRHMVLPMIPAWGRNFEKGSRQEWEEENASKGQCKWENSKGKCESCMVIEA